MLTELADVLRSAGLKVMEEPGWKTRGHGQMAGVLTITCHHTANGGTIGNSPSLRVVKEGRPGLSGPLSQLFLARDGTWHVVAAGVSYHAGVSRENRFTNKWAVGIEAEAKGVPGTASDWPKVQVDSYARGCAALVKRYQLSVADVRGHKETCDPPGRKSDPSFDMAAFRRQVGAELVKLNTPIEEIPTMELTDKIKLSEAAAKAMSIPGYTLRKTGDELSLSYILQWGGPGTYRALGKIQTLTTQYSMLASQIKTLTAAVTALAEQSPEGIKAAFEDGTEKLKEELEKIDVQVSLTSGETEDIRE
jgi:hypothetical protein